MTTYTRNTLSGSLAPVNNELEKIEVSLREKLDRNPSVAQNNEMLDDLDMNSNRIINYPDAVNDSDLITKGQVASLAPVQTVNGQTGNVSIPTQIQIDNGVVFDNIAEMKSSSLEIGQLVKCKRYYALGDLVEGLEFEVVAGSTGTDDGGSFHNLANGNQAELITDGVVNIKQYGADDSSDSTAEIQATIDLGPSKIYSEGDFTTTGLDISTSVKFSIGGLEITNDDTSALVIQDSVSVDNRVSDVHVADSLFSGATGTQDNFAYISTFNTKRTVVENIVAEGGRTGVRIGYEPSGAHSVDSHINGVHLEGCEVFGIEHIESDRTIASNINIGNSGTQIGSHGLRYTGTLKGSVGNVTYGFNIRDRLTTAVSLQEGASHNVIGVGVIGNTGEAGVQANTSSLIDAKTMLPHTVIRDTTADAVNLSNLSHVFFDVLADNAGQKGLRIGGGVAPSTENANMGRVMVVGAQNGAASIASDFNLVDILADTCQTTATILISGNHNMIRVIAKNCGDLTVYITGSNNHVSLIEDGTSTTGLRVDGDNNFVNGLVTSITTVNGDGNVISARLLGNLFNNGARNTVGKASISESASAPTTGTWDRGDRVYNSSPSAGGTVGWVCVSGGTSGTWKAFGNIDV